MSLATFAAGLNFALDDYQLEACRLLEAGRGVLVAAPTGAGKTVVGEFAVDLALEQGGKCFYTTPIKALSNQKYHDLQAKFGPDRIGLLTGDQVVNGEAPIVVMTTEVLRNMIYADSATLTGLAYVVMDEVHYLSDPTRGPVWEEIILALDLGVKLVGLSATVSNVEEFGDWLDQVRGDMATVVSERRPVPLFQRVFAGRRLLNLFEGVEPTAGGGQVARVNPELIRLAAGESRLMRDDSRSMRGHSGRGKSGSRMGLAGRPAGRFASRSHLVPRRSQVVAQLDASNLLPAIYFIFSRKGCDQGVEQLMDDGVELTSPEERRALAVIADAAAQALSPADLAALGFKAWRVAFLRGVACHHAGLLPVFKQAVEQGFTQGLIKVVFATETLALGINMPARTVVLDKLVKYNGIGHVEITPGEYTQLTGRAGRRGIDVEGYAVVTWQAGLDPRALAGLAAKRTYPLRSAFTPTYNMAVNLLAWMGFDRASQILRDSFAQFQSDRARQARGKSHSDNLVVKFEALVSVMESLGYVEPARLRLTAKGEILSRLYGDHDLLTAEAISAGLFDGLTTPSLAASLSTLVFEPRVADRNRETRLPDAASARAVASLRRLQRELGLTERDHRLEPARPIEPAFSRLAYAWADGAGLGESIGHSGMSAGDFVRWIRQVIDCAGQIAHAVPGTALARNCRDLVAVMRRGVIDIDMSQQ
ncbi:MAG: DEAD/DEAH box helicase [Propionibacteriaceae bacterium]|jgi:ATP-dependent RNA helicase HelY|nr:DEAD/DEAH box helicase [Propionibacteriaceae bacterium]